jgi:hypothetical protein
MVADEFVPLVVNRERTGIDGKEEWANAHFLFAPKCAGLFQASALEDAPTGTRQAHPEKLWQFSWT